MRFSATGMLPMAPLKMSAKPPMDTGSFPIRRTLLTNNEGGNIFQSVDSLISICVARRWKSGTDEPSSRACLAFELQQYRPDLTLRTRCNLSKSSLAASTDIAQSAPLAISSMSSERTFASVKLSTEVHEMLFRI
jgi:hypothetical protein